MTPPIDDTKAIHDQKRRALTPYLKFIRNLDPETSLETRIEHVTYDFFEKDIDWLIDTLGKTEISAGISVPAIHLETEETVRNSVRRLIDAGHEIVVHGYRHTSYMATPHKTADAELEAIIDCFKSNLDIRPTGFHVPFMRCSPGTVRAAEKYGIEWIVGIEPHDVSTSISFLHPKSPYDLQLFERGYTGSTVARCMAEATEDRLLLCHPNIHAIHNARASFAEFLKQGEFAKPSAVADGKTERPGLLLDCFPPFRVE